MADDDLLYLSSSICLLSEGVMKTDVLLFVYHVVPINELEPHRETRWERRQRRIIHLWDWTINNNNSNNNIIIIEHDNNNNNNNVSATIMGKIIKYFRKSVEIIAIIIV